ncbi:MAG: SpoIIE family protein phosphatase [Candidatus Hydrogenedentes bacterium]|nr:SpoIIE family protein phosphatase [Candidatus Hydrogenedentota bacterium]
MLRGYIIIETDGRKVPVEESLVIGRTADSGLMIEDNAASRRHMEIKARPDRFIWKDLGSTNGTLVNGAKMLAGELKNGDTIQIGETTLRFEVHGRAEASRPAESGGGTGEESRLFTETIMDAHGQVQKQEAPNKTTKLLEAVYSVANEIATNYEPCSLMDGVLTKTLKAINAQRGAIFLAGPAAELLPCPHCGAVHSIANGKLQQARIGDIQISSTVASRVIRDGESVLYQDTDSDMELNASESIMSLQLRSIICVPLRAKHGILGILYIDSDRQDQNYSHDDLLLAASVGNSAGLALENAHMHQEILEKQRIEQDLATAWTIQEGFLVKEWPQEDPRFDVYGETRPAKTVGGDFYDYVRPNRDKIGILIGDVSGKGVPAALTMAQLLAQFRLLARDLDAPGEVLKELNRGLVKRSQRGMFCTLCYLTLDLTSGHVVCANAGHHPVLRVGRTEVSTFGDATGPPAGILPEGPWVETRAIIDPGDTLLLYTDGIVEARSMTTLIEGATPSPPVEYEEAGLMRCASRQFGKPARALIDAVILDVQRYTAPAAPHDDCTMMALRYAGGR